MEIYFNPKDHSYFIPYEVVDVTHQFWYFGLLWTDRYDILDFVEIENFVNEWELVDDI